VQQDSTRARTKGLDPATRAVHVGERPSRPEFTPVVTPIYPGSTYVYEDLEEMDAALGGAEGKYVYTRYGNPTSSALEAVIADLEGTSSAVAFASGMAAVHAAITTSVTPGQAIVASRDLYGASYSMLAGFMREWGCTVEFVDILDLDQVAEAVERLKPALIVCEVISNPLLRVTDVPAVMKLAKSVRAAVLVDSTFSPVIYSPAADGAQLVVHSLTKYISGHGDVTGGVVATTSMRREKLANFVKMAGGLLGPFESWLALRGVKTLPLRMERQCASAAVVAGAIAAHPLVSRVYYPGLADHPSHATAQKLFGERGFGGMIAFEIKDAGREEVVDFLEALDLIVPATSLGDVYSLALSPAMSSHRALTPEERSVFGIAEGLVRLSVGIEAPGDILADLDRALQAATRRSVHATA
jgi:cystathionine gamma-synthase/methionine-gamma-lyase